MNLRQQIVQGRIEETAALLNLSEDIAFVRFAHSLLTGQSHTLFDPADLIEGCQEKQIDTFTIEQDSEEAIVYLLQVKNKPTFPSNALILLRNGLDWVFNKTKKEIQRLRNVRLKDRILEYRSIQNEIGPSNIRIRVGFVAKGLTKGLSPEFKQEARAIREQFDNGTFEPLPQNWTVD